MRACAFLLAGALGVHELRYLIAFRGDVGQTLANHGHGYLAVTAPVIGMLSALALGHLLVRAAAAPAGASRTRRRLRVLWPAASIALLSIYVSQELVEGVLAPGHPGGLEGVFGAGGYVAAPLSVAFGAVVAVALRVAVLVESSARGLCLYAPRLTAADARLAIARATVVAAGRGRVLADHAAGRGPPLISV